MYGPSKFVNVWNQPLCFNFVYATLVLSDFILLKFDIII
jgi:hypothetical protein